MNHVTLSLFGICFLLKTECRAKENLQDVAPRFGILHDKFWKDNEAFQIIGGDLHYFRILPEVNYWLFSYPKMFVIHISYYA